MSVARVKKLGLMRKHRSEELNMDKLRPCPFCGGKAELIKIPVPPYPDKYYVRCSNQNDCKVAVHTYRGGTAEEAIEDWNRRAET